MELVAVLARIDDGQGLSRYSLFAKNTQPHHHFQETNIMSSSAAAVSAINIAAPSIGNRVATGSTRYNQIVEFVYDEAALLDQWRFTEWSDLLATDLSYTAPIRMTRTGAEKYDTIVRTMSHFNDDHSSMMGRVGRLQLKSAWAEDPPSRTRRLVSNVRVWETTTAGEYEVESYLLLSRSRYEYATLNILSCVRHDLLRVEGDSFKLARREIIIDQSVLGMANLAIFL
jgi:3-phenylpropionate/cinnamic acid dioxygenase small subunit